MSEQNKVVLLAGQKRNPRGNHCTHTAAVALSRTPTGLFGSHFVAHYASFVDYVRSFDQPGVAVVAIDRYRQHVAGIAWAAAPVGQPNGLIIGRHSQAHLLLTGDDAVSLRHLAVIVDPLTDCRPGCGVTYQVLDLRSTQGFQLENGQSLGGLRSDGPAFLATGNYIFYFLVTGDPTDWPYSARDAWSFLPERIYLEERPRRAVGSGLHQPAPRKFPVPLQRKITQVERVRGPARADLGSLCPAGEHPVAELTIIDNALGEGITRGYPVASRRRHLRLPIAASGLENGILLGRAERCDANGALQHEKLSRVHLLLFNLQGRTYALDTASTNGCYTGPDGDREFTLRQLQADDTIYLGEEIRLLWQSLGEPAPFGSHS